MKTNRNGIESFMRIIRNVAVITSFVLMAIIVMPKSVWANSCSVTSSGDIVCSFDSSTFTDKSGAAAGDLEATQIRIKLGASGNFTGGEAYSSGSTSHTFPKSVIFGYLPLANENMTYPFSGMSIQMRQERYEGDSLKGYSDWVDASGNYPTIYKVVVSGDAYGTYKVAGNTSAYELAGNTVEFSATNIASGYAFDKWTDLNNNTKSTSANYTHTVSSVVNENVISGSAKLGYVKVDSITVSPTSVSAGNTVNLVGSVNPSNATNKDIVWSIGSTNTCGATITSSGALTTLSSGTVEVLATVINGKTESSNYVEKVNITSSQVDVTDITLANTSTNVNGTLTLSPTVIPTNATKKTVTWSLKNAGTAIGSTVSGTTFNAGSTAGTATITATVAGGKGAGDFTKDFTITVTPKATAITIADTYITVGYTRTISKTITPTDASYKGIEWSTDDAAKVTVNGNGDITGVAVGTAIPIKATLKNNDDTTLPQVSCNVAVYGKPTITYNSDRTLSVSLPSKVATGSDDSVNISDVKGGYIVAFIDGSEVASTSSYQTSGTSFTVPASFAEGVASNNQSKFSDEKDITFRVYPYGVKASDSNSKTRNESAYADTTGRVYKVTVSGTGIKTAYTYALNGTSIKITATPESNYTFSKWSDSTTTNPRTITVSGSATYTAEATSKSSSNSSSSGSSTGSSKSSGSGAGYDKVPKTGEGNALMCMWILLAVSMIVAGGAVFIALNPNVIEKIGSKKNNK